MGHDGNKPSDAPKPSDHQGDKHDNKDNAEKNARKARGEASNELESGSLNDTTKATRNKQHESGKSGITDYKFPPAKGLFGDAAHTPLTKESEQKRDADFRKNGWGDSNDLQGAKAENPALEQRLHDRAANHHRDIAAQLKDAIKHGSLESKDVSDKTKLADKPHEKLIPKDGETLTVKQLLNDYKTPFIDAYEHSKQLKDGEPGKSKTLESVVDRLKTCPWADQIRIKFDSTVNNPDYNPVESRITIRPQESLAEQIELFTHEGFHATHQALKQMYMGDKPLDRKEYAEHLGGLEAQTFEAEIHVHNELTAAMGAKPVSYKWRDAHDNKQPDKDLGALYAKEGLQGLKSFILDEAHTDMKLDGQSHSWNYRTYYEATQPAYATKWNAAHEELEKRFTKDSALKPKLETGGF